MTVSELKRKFKFDKLDLPDLNPSMTPKEVLKAYTGTYPELTNAMVSGPEIINDEAVYTFTTELGTKG